MDPTTTQNQIEKILRSRSFANKAQLRKLLEVLYRHIDSQAALNPELIVSELWPDETKTKRSADVATEINRLRNALESYYAREGNADPIAIALPNRSPASTEAANGKRWIVAAPRSVADPQTPADQSHARTVSPRKLFWILAPVAALGILFYVSVRVLAGGHDHPQSVRLDGERFTVMNAEGKELWSKTFPDGFQAEYYAHGIAQRMWIGDLEGTGRTNVLLLYQPAVNSRSHTTTLICYSEKGKERWRWAPGKALPELEGNPATFVIDGIAVLKPTDKTRTRIVLSSSHDPLYPAQIALIDRDGKLLSEYWHSGHLQYLTLADLDGDGKQEIVATGISNGYHEATLVVLDPERVFGASIEAARPEIQIHGMGSPSERLRLIFPRSDLNKTLSVYNQGEEPTIDHGRIRFSSRECAQYPGCVIWYEFDKSFNLLSVLADDGFRSAHAEFYANGKNTHLFGAQEEAEFRKIRCLAGCKTDLISSLIH